MMFGRGAGGRGAAGAPGRADGACGTLPPNTLLAAGPPPRITAAGGVCLGAGGRGAAGTPSITGAEEFGVKLVGVPGASPVVAPVVALVGALPEVPALPVLEAPGVTTALGATTAPGIEEPPGPLPVPAVPGCVAEAGEPGATTAPGTAVAVALLPGVDAAAAGAEGACGAPGAKPGVAPGRLPAPSGEENAGFGGSVGRGGNVVGRFTGAPGPDEWGAEVVGAEDNGGVKGVPVESGGLKLLPNGRAAGGTSVPSPAGRKGAAGGSTWAAGALVGAAGRGGAAATGPGTAGLGTEGAGAAGTGEPEPLAPEEAGPTGVEADAAGAGVEGASGEENGWVAPGVWGSRASSRGRSSLELAGEIGTENGALATCRTGSATWGGGSLAVGASCTSAARGGNTTTGNGGGSAAGRPPPSSRALIFSATSSSTELECVFFSKTPNSGRRSMIMLGLTSSSRASSLIRILLIDEKS